MNKPSIAKNTAIITSLACLERTLGFLYRIVLARLLGAEGVGVYQIALSHFFLFQTAAGGGIPVTLSRTVSKLRAANQTRKSVGALLAALLLGACVSIPLTLLFLPLASHIPLFTTDTEPFKVLLFPLSLTAAYIAIKGYFWGNKQFLAPALFEMAEEILTVILGVALLSRGGFSPTEGATRAAWAHSLAAIAVCVIAVVTLLKQKPRYSSPTPFLRPMLSAAAPITAVRSGATIVSAAVAVLLPAALMREGMSESAALQAYGVATGMVLPLLASPLTVIGSLAIVLVPELAEDFQKKNNQRLTKNIERGVLFAVTIACLLIPFFLVVGKPLGTMLYQNELAGEMLSRCAILLLPMSVNAILFSMLNSLGMEKQTFTFSLVGSGVFLLCIVGLPAHIGIYAFPVGMTLQFTVESICALLLLLKKCSPSKSFFTKCGACAFLSLPIASIGSVAQKGFSLILGQWLAPLASAGVLLLVTAASYLLFFKKYFSRP